MTGQAHSTGHHDGSTSGADGTLGTVEAWHVDSFTSTRFKGNPAVVIILHAAPDDGLVEALGEEFDMPATAILWPNPAGTADDARFCLRWRTATAELPLCGHGTLAAGHVLYRSGRIPDDVPIEFETASGRLAVRQAGGQVVLDFPAFASRPVKERDEIALVLGERTGKTIRSVHRTGLDLLVELDGEEAVIGAAPDLEQLERIDVRGMILTAKPRSGASYDFVSRFFSPATGLPEDSVTGSAHCALAPFWLDRTGNDSLLGYQASRRGGYVRVAMSAPGRVELAGNAVTVSRGTLALD